MSANKSKEDPERYWRFRKLYKRLLSRGLMLWKPTNELSDLNVHVSRIYTQNMLEYLVIMRIKPGGFRAPSPVPPGTKIIFHIFLGSVKFQYKGETQVLVKGQHVATSPGNCYAVRNATPNATAYLLMQYVDLE